LSRLRGIDYSKLSHYLKGITQGIDLVKWMNNNPCMQ